MAAIVILTTMLGFGFLSHSIRAQTISATPYSSYRYESPSATIQVKTTSTKSIWDAAIKKWNATHAFDFKLVSTGGTIQADSFSSLAPAYSTIAGITYSNYTGTQLLSAQTRLNTGILNKYRYTNAEKTNVAEHELGHTMGLLHNPSQKKCDVL
ncbi:hypothetical protein [Secundilactobacillus silagei]|uniref:hypothetical protein n=1 Tax=Secundilactobacillus silagei TaxID=1293415 RepID=UPI0006D244DE|nr:hypothetical protein [Secundilactobacillus silagei]